MGRKSTSKKGRPEPRQKRPQMSSFSKFHRAVKNVPPWGPCLAKRRPEPGETKSTDLSHHPSFVTTLPWAVCHHRGLPPHPPRRFVTTAFCHHHPRGNLSPPAVCHHLPRLRFVTSPRNGLSPPFPLQFGTNSPALVGHHLPRRFVTAPPTRSYTPLSHPRGSLGDDLAPPAETTWPPRRTPMG